MAEEKNDQSRDDDELSPDEIRAILETLKRGYSSDPEIRARAIEMATRYLRKLEATDVWQVEKLPPPSSINQPTGGGEISDEGSGPSELSKDGWTHRRR